MRKRGSTSNARRCSLQTGMVAMQGLGRRSSRSGRQMLLYVFWMVKRAWLAALAGRFKALGGASWRLSCPVLSPLCLSLQWRLLHHPLATHGSSVARHTTVARRAVLIGHSLTCTKPGFSRCWYLSIRALCPHRCMPHSSFFTKTLRKRLSKLVEKSARNFVSCSFSELRHALRLGSSLPIWPHHSLRTPHPPLFDRALPSHGRCDSPRFCPRPAKWLHP